jgi:phosphatidylethanolamine/phosphatidyl-N-methylethanolamine N-methyltransferase
MLAKEESLFLGRWLRAPLRMGAVAPSSPALARTIAQQVDPCRPGFVVELGSGTGAVTTALLGVGVPPERLILLERDATLYRWLKGRRPDLTIIQDDAAHLRARLAERGVSTVNTIVSGLPLLSIPERKRHAILDQAFACLGPDGIFVQFTYGPTCPIPRQVLASHGLKAEAVATVWLNLPPATVWRAYRPEAARQSK